ncbi:MAG: esterase-like activity of phytase family protein [Sphingomonas sp.]|nr:esterase-like activity of phytase family protein [Sphingomonas sp.]
MATFLNERRGPPKAWRLLGLLAGFFALTTFIAPEPLSERTETAEGRLFAVPVALNPDDPAQRRVGGLIFRRGWALASDQPRLGGISAMHVEGGQVIAISDSGDVLLFPLPGAGPARVRVIALPLGHASALRKRDRDTEALAVHGDQAWVAFERHNLIARHRRSDWRLEAFARPAAMRDWGRNSGPETLVRLADGRFLAIEEGGGDDHSRIALFDGDPAMAGTNALPGRYRRVPGYRATDAAQLPDGRLLILNRRAGLGRFPAVLTIAEMPDRRRGTTIEGRELARFARPLTTDNLEALSVAREGGRTIVRIASDDNFMGFQRTLLLEFELAE